VNAVQSASSPQYGGKNKSRNKSKNNNNKIDNPKKQTQPPVAENQQQRKLTFPCLICAEDHYTRDYPHQDEVSKFLKGDPQPVILTHPFPQRQSKVMKNPTPPQGGNLGPPPKEDPSSSAHIYMFNGVYLTSRTKTYETPLGKNGKQSVTNGIVTDPPSTSVTPPSGPLQIEKPIFDSILRPPKSTI